MLDDLPLFPLQLVAVPGELIPLHVFEPRYRELVQRCRTGDEPFGIVFADDDGLREVACTVQIVETLNEFADGRSNILVRGEDPVRLVEVFDSSAYRTATAEVLVDDVHLADPARQDRAVDVFRRLALANDGDEEPNVPPRGPQLSYALAARVEIAQDVKQQLLEDRDEGHRVEVITDLLERLTTGVVVAREIQARARRNGRVRTPEEIAEELGLA
jgi:Lon protease-like protein